MKKYIALISVFCIVLALLLTGCTAQKEGIQKKTKIVTSFYPIYIMTLN